MRAARKAITFATPGNLSVAYSSQKGSYEKIGRQVRISFNIVTSTFTYTTAAGLVNITGLPFICADDAPDLYTGALVHGNVASALHLAAQLQNNSAVILIIGSANAVAPTNLNVSHFPTATNFTLRGQIVFRTT